MEKLIASLEHRISQSELMSKDLTPGTKEWMYYEGKINALNQFKREIQNLDKKVF